MIMPQVDNRCPFCGQNHEHAHDYVFTDNPKKPVKVTYVWKKCEKCSKSSKKPIFHLIDRDWKEKRIKYLKKELKKLTVVK